MRGHAERYKSRRVARGHYARAACACTITSLAFLSLFALEMQLILIFLQYFVRSKEQITLNIQIMWIKGKPEILGESGAINTNFLYKSGKVYVMDNHLCASWCWLQEIDTGKKYNYLHIDRHYDLCQFKKEVKTLVIDKGIDISKLTFEEYANLGFEVHSGIYAKLFRWDNYILNLQQLYPKLFTSTIFITKKEGGRTDFVKDEYEIEQFLGQYRDWLDYSKNGWIINVDLDYFFAPIRGYFQLYTDETIRLVAEEIKKHLSKVDVVTIALSPSCCGGWKKALGALKIFAETLELDIDLSTASNHSS